MYEHLHSKFSSTILQQIVLSSEMPNMLIFILVGMEPTAGPELPGRVAPPPPPPRKVKKKAQLAPSGPWNAEIAERVKY